MKTVIPVTLAAVVACSTAFAAAQNRAPGPATRARVEANIGCNGTTVPTAMADMKKLGFASMINLRQASEPGAHVDAETADAKAIGINYVHLPFDAAMPDPMLVDKLLAAISLPANSPALIKCATGGRAAAMWMIKRVLVDQWDVDRAATEATGLGLTPALKTYVTEQIQARRR